MPTLPSNPDILRAMFLEADRYIVTMRPVLQGMRALERLRLSPPSDWDAMRRSYQLEALSRKLPDVEGLDLLRDYVCEPSLQALGDEYEAVHRQSCNEAGTSDTNSDDYKFYFMVNLADRWITIVRRIRHQIIVKLEGHTTPGTVVKAKATEDRDKFIYEEYLNVTSLKNIIIKINKIPEWDEIKTKQGIKDAAKRYAKRHGLPPPPPRQTRSDHGQHPSC
jgi:hypothetical protein